jgi:hypothetical protein
LIEINVGIAKLYWEAIGDIRNLKKTNRSKYVGKKGNLINIQN